MSKCTIGKMYSIADEREFSNERLRRLARVLGTKLDPYWTVIVREDKNTFVAISSLRRKYIKKPVEGDKFNPYIAFALAYFEEKTGIRYLRLSEFFDNIAKCTKTNDPAINFVKMYFEEATGLSEADLAKIISEAKDVSGGKMFMIQLDDEDEILSAEENIPEVMAAEAPVEIAEPVVSEEDHEPIIRINIPGFIDFKI